MESSKIHSAEPAGHGDQEGRKMATPECDSSWMDDEDDGGDSVKGK